MKSLAGCVSCVSPRGLAVFAFPAVGVGHGTQTQQEDEDEDWRSHLLDVGRGAKILKI